MAFVQVSFRLKDGVDPDMFSAILQYYDVDSIWEELPKIHGYYPDDILGKPKFRERLIIHCQEFIEDYKVTDVEDLNWNKLWESNFPSVEIDDICYIYAEFHPFKEGFQHYIRIAPKMAFGTGHHETTYMMIQQMAKIDFTDKSVLDLGCGTGILAVLAAKMNAMDIVAIDIEKPSYDNTIEHAEMNEVAFSTLLGGVEDVPKRQYDIVLANINRTVLLNYKETIKKFVADGGILLLSGILDQDEKLIRDAYSTLELEALNKRGKWNCFHYSK